jgi:hypothetical protein
MKRAKLCDLCGKPYYRRSLTSVWDRQNPGHRAGWGKTEIRACTTCAPAKVAQRALIVSTLRVVDSGYVPKPRDASRRRFLAALRRGRWPRASSA